MDHFELTAPDVAIEADVSQRKVESIHAINIKEDIMRATARRIEQVVLGSVTRYICDMDYDTKSAAEKIVYLESQVAYWKRESELKTRIIEKYMSE